MQAIVPIVLGFIASQCGTHIFADKTTKERQTETALQQKTDRIGSVCYIPKMELMDLLVTDDQNLCQEGCTNKKVLDSIMKNKKSFMSKTMVCYTKCPCNCPVSFCSNPDYFVEDPCPSEMEEDEVALCLPISQGVGSADNKDKQPTGSGSERTTKYTVSPTGFAQLSELTSPRTHAAGTTDDERQRTSSHFLPALETSETDGSLKPSQELGTMSAIATTSSANQAMRYCLIGKNSDMADERDLRTIGVLTLLRNAR
ncbi:unnamed protein product [Heligmosomoides polygyrus]|uniref:Secreted protein n=1 Tax=Heligmosomoides polygyrus TaxID=6339 RepID=A0A183FG32_HELPZ|nr:unnamed protein product [Heligmosomoides polygyrus]